MALTEKFYAKTLRNFDVEYENNDVLQIESQEKVDSEEKVEEEKSRDEVAERMKLDLPGASGRELLLYFANRFKQTHGYDYPVDWIKETAILKSFKERYGENAGPMIKILFDDYSGTWNRSPVTATALSRGSKWITDRLYVDLQESRKVKVQSKKKSGELLSSNEFFARFL